MECGASSMGVKVRAAYEKRAGSARLAARAGQGEAFTIVSRATAKTGRGHGRSAGCAWQRAGAEAPCSRDQWSDAAGGAPRRAMPAKSDALQCPPAGAWAAPQCGPRPGPRPVQIARPQKPLHSPCAAVRRAWSGTQLPLPPCGCATAARQPPPACACGHGHGPARAPTRRRPPSPAGPTAHDTGLPPPALLPPPAPSAKPAPSLQLHRRHLPLAPPR